MAAQAPGPLSKGSTGIWVRLLLDEGRAHLEHDDPLRALEAYCRVRAMVPEDQGGLLGMAESHLVLGNSALAERYVEAAEERLPSSQKARALHVRILLRAGDFEAALDMAEKAIQSQVSPSVELLAAHASALFRVQRTGEAAKVYQKLLRLDPLHAEAHLRLGSGLLPPCAAPALREVTEGVRAFRRGRFSTAGSLFQEALASCPGHPVAHRLLGESLYAMDYEASMVRRSPEFRHLASALPTPSPRGMPLGQFLPAYAELSPERQEVAVRALSLFASRLEKLVAMAGRHDLLLEDERTTDIYPRSRLRGKRTFDGRVWDDVRGMGGLQAATGIESLDEATQFGFDTLSHEFAHQAHLYAFKPSQRARIRSLYRQAKAGGYCLDFYAASNEAEYFGQGVEAFVSLAKRPGCERTHGHTRFELYRLDRRLYDLIAELVDWDPLRDPAERQKLLPLAFEAALRSGRPEDGRVAVEMMDPSRLRQQLERRARRACLLAKSY